MIGSLAIDTTTFPGYMLLPGGIALIIAWLMLRLRRRRANAPRITTPAEQLDRRRQARGLRGDLEQVMVEVEQLAKRFSAQLDAKSMRLEKLIDEADARIAELERLQPPGDGAHAGGPADASPQAAGQPAEFEAAIEPIPPAEEVPSAADSAAAQAIYRLADAGSDPVEIARALGEHVGKVELILALRET